GKQKDTARNSIKKQEFDVHIVDEDNVEMVNQTAVSLPPNESEVEVAQFTLVNSTKISVPGVKQAKIRMECILEHSLQLGDKEQPGGDLLIGKVVQFHVANELYENGRIDAEGLAAVSRLAGANYAKIGEVFAIERPK